MLYCPDYQFLASSLAGMYRSLSSHGVKAPLPPLYQQEPYTLFVPKKTAPSFADLMVQADNTLKSSKAISLPDESAYGFIGRDYQILRLERAFWQNHLLVVQGMGGAIAHTG